jgi:choline dehydrogenase-like flavoprotein/nucleoside-diphosphate-sugar epimerase
MELLDLREVAAETSLDADVCIVGSGPAGLTLARELSGSGARVLVLESGGRERDSWADSLNCIESVGVPRVMDQSVVRNRVLGGSSATWSGRVATFDDVDFAVRAAVPHSGWPIDRAELEHYFVRSMLHLGIAVADNNRAPVPALIAAVSPDVDPHVFTPYGWSYSRDDADPGDFMRFGPRAERMELPGVRCLLHATVTHIDTTATGDRVERLEVRTPDGGRRWVRAPRVVLCAGAIENARLLLASNRTTPAGVGNAHDVVGRYLMDHLRGPVGFYRSEDLLAVQRVFGGMRANITGQPATLSPGLALSAELQADEDLLNCALWISGDVADDDPTQAARNLLRRRDVLRSLRSVLSHPLILGEGVKRLVRDHRTALSKMSAIALLCMVEQRPDPDSRITLSRHTDALGVPLSAVDWRVSEQERRTVRRASQAFAAEMRRLGLPVPELLPMITDEQADFHLPDVAHPTGTTRMSADPRTGVVDTDCAVHGVRGLYIAGSSVFPTSGHANPTQMIVALAVRLADHLKRELQAAADPAVQHSPRQAKLALQPSAELVDSPDGMPSPTPAARWAVTGATGMVGGALVRAVLDCQVAMPRCLVRSENVPDALRRPGTEVRRVDLDDAGGLKSALDGCDVVVHCAFDVRDPGSNVGHVENLLRAAHAAGVRRFVQVSSIAVYESGAGQIVDERSPLTGEVDGYAGAKAACDRRATELAARLSMELAVVQPTIVYGPGSRPWTITPARRLLEGGIVLPGKGEGVCNAVYADDVASALVLAARSAQAAGQTFLVSGPETISWRRFYEGMAAALGVTGRVRLESEDGPAGRLRLWLRRVDSLVERVQLKLDQLDHPALARAAARCRIPGPHLPMGSERELYEAGSVVDLTGARSLGYEPRYGFDAGMVPTAEWLRTVFHRAGDDLT